MGLLKAGAGALSGVLADQWREFFYCDAIDSGILVVKGNKRTNSKRSSNKKGDNNIISNGSIIAVNEGQCMLLVDQGKVVEVCAEAGEFVYDDSSEPSVFYGGLGEGIERTFEAIGRRFTMGGDSGRDQRVYYVNTKEIMGNKYGTANPVPFRVVDHNIGLDMDISIRCHGEYAYRIVNPILFYTNLCGNVTEEYARSNIDGQLKAELMTALQPAFARISELGVRYSALPGHTMEIADALNEVLSEKWVQSRGIEITSFAVSSVTASEEDERTIQDLQKTAMLRNPNMAAATLVGAQAEAMKSAAANQSAGSMMAFAGMNMAASAGGMNAGDLYAMSNAQAVVQASPGPGKQEAGWSCACGASGNSGKFCLECGKPKPTDGWACSCGAVNQGRFCQECGKAKPAGARLYRCDKCGWKPEDPSQPPKFCPECGDPFDEKDIG